MKTTATLRYSLVGIFALLLSFCSPANNLTISNLSLTGQNSASGFKMIRFDVSWENSWRASVGPSNWDAAWVLAKYRLKTSEEWQHATFHYVDGTGSGDGHTEPANCNISSSNDNGAGGAHGVFVHRDADMLQGSVSYPGVQLRWDYAADGLADADSVEICVFGIEMVYMPQGSFYLGDGSSTLRGQFREQAANTPFQVTSESALTLGGGGATALHNNNGSGMSTADDFNDATSKALPASWPKGYNAVYVMKYEISQKQYVEFLNKLNRTQQSSRIVSTTVGNFMGNNASAIPKNRNGVTVISDPGGFSPYQFGNDLNANGTPDESDDGQTIACNWLTSADLLAYLDWAALRPMTEFEYEKACRGPLTPVAGEYAWGSANIMGATGISNAATGTEIASNAGANCVHNNAGGVPGPMRVGNFAQTATSRSQAGAGYYGIMELSGNVWEDVVLAGCEAGRSFTGLNGNGNLNPNGDADVDYWPGINNNNASGTPNGPYAGVQGCRGDAGISFTGGTWNANTWLTVSDRSYRGTGWNGINGRDSRNGGRGVRTAP